MGDAWTKVKSLLIYFFTRRDKESLEEKRCIPTRIQLSLYNGTRSRMYAIPTDVEVDAPVGVAQASQAVDSTDNHITVNGSYCAVVHDELKQHYLLTCHHVAACSLNDLSEHRVPTFAYFKDHFVGVTTKQLLSDRFAPNITGAIDAALVKITEQEALDRVLSSNGMHISLIGFAENSAELQQLAKRRLYLLTRDSRKLPCRFNSILAERTIVYGSQSIQTQIYRVAQLTLTADQTMAGYSGGAIVTSDGILLAMHIAGVDNFSYAIPAYLLIQNTYLRTPVWFGLA